MLLGNCFEKCDSEGASIGKKNFKKNVDIILSEKYKIML